MTSSFTNGRLLSLLRKKCSRVSQIKNWPDVLDLAVSLAVVEQGLERENGRA